MLRGTRGRCSQHADLRSLFLETGDNIFGEEGTF